MNNDELKVVFDQQASGYERQQETLSPIIKGLHFMLESVFAELPANAHILCVGLGTGAELVHLAKCFPGWSFMALEPSGKMLDMCRKRVEEEGLSSRCQFHEGYLESLSNTEKYDGATCFMVSQFILDNDARSAFFRDISCRLNAGGILASADLTADVNAKAFDPLLQTWVNMLHAAEVPPETIKKTREAWAQHVAILPANVVASIIEVGGFEAPVAFYQAGFIQAWFSKRL